MDSQSSSDISIPVDKRKFVAQAILYLRPRTDEAVKALDLDENSPYQHTIAPLNLGNIFTDTPVGDNSLNIALRSDTDEDTVSREPSNPFGSPRVFRLGFDSIDTIENQYRGFIFGTSTHSNVKLPSFDDDHHGASDYFCVHYNFNSGALLVTAMEKIRLGTTTLNKNQSHILMPGTIIRCRGFLQFTVEFPDASSYPEDHEKNYRKYAAKFGIIGAAYIPPPLFEYAQLGARYVSQTRLGEGAFGKVYKALDIRTGDHSAIKMICGGAGEREMKEVDIMRKTCHENIIKYKDAFELPGGKICIAMELAIGELDSHLEAREKIPCEPQLPLRCIRHIGMQALSALQYLHSIGITHRDMKPTNMLITNWDIETDLPTIKLADFGLAGVRLEHSTFCGTEGYMAPELQKELMRLDNMQNSELGESVPGSAPLKYDNSVDIWALGKILLELFDEVPSGNPGAREDQFHHQKEPVKALALCLIQKMMDEVPRKRPTAAQCLQHDWMTMQDLHIPVAQKRKRSSSPSTEGSFDREVKRASRNSLAGVGPKSRRISSPRSHQIRPTPSNAMAPQPPIWLQLQERMFDRSMDPGIPRDIFSQLRLSSTQAPKESEDVIMLDREPEPDSTGPAELIRNAVYPAADPPRRSIFFRSPDNPRSLLAPLRRLAGGWP